jgi:hypothetical protein
MGLILPTNRLRGRSSCGLKGDLLRSPKKAAIFGILILVALWFWAPLLTKWGSQGRESKAEVTSGTVAPQAVAGTSGALAQVGSQGTSQATEKRKSLSWTELLSAIESDGRMRPATLDHGFVSPFMQDAPTPDDAKTDVAKETTKPADLHSAELGLVLTSTLVGPGSRLATIKGETYRQGDFVMVGDAGDEVEASSQRSTANVTEFRVEKVQPNYVILTHQAKSCRLDLQRGALAGRARKIRVPERQVN